MGVYEPPVILHPWGTARHEAADQGFIEELDRYESARIGGSCPAGTLVSCSAAIVRREFGRGGVAQDTGCGCRGVAQDTWL